MIISEPKEEIMRLTYFKRIKLIYWGAFSFMIMYTAFLYYVDQYKLENGEYKSFLEAFYIIVPSLTIACLMVSYIFFNDKLRMLSNDCTLREKLQVYQNAMMIKLSCLEVPLLVAMIAFMLTADILFLGISLFIIVAMWFNKPTRNEIASDLKLDEEETDLMTKQNSYS